VTLTPDSTAGAWIALVAFGFLPSEIWRVVAIFLSRGVDESSPLLGWVRAVATALLAGVVAQLLLRPSGALAAIPVAGRIGALAVGLAIFWATRRSVLAAVLAAEAAIIGVGWFVT
jgi:Branched-chain amino acid transport protein (AzlD)